MAFAGSDFIASYRLVNLVRAGKTCQVWEANNDAKGQRVALKVLRPEHAGNREQTNLLRHEYTVGHVLDHPHLIKIFEFVSDRSKTYLAMEYFPAPNMKQLVQSGYENYAHLVPRIVQQSAEALEYLHNQGFVHRDIKPDNFLIDNAGNVKLIDFALVEKRKGLLARLIPGKSRIQGTRSYMSPEQIRGQAVDQRSDIYSYGCSIFELLAGKTPFTGVSNNDLLMKHLRAGAPALEATNRNVSPAFSQLVRRMLAKDPKSRPQSMSDVLREVKSIELFKVPPEAPVDGAARKGT